MAQWYRARVTVPHASGLPEDSIVNTWHYMVTGSGDRDVLAPDFQAQLDQFYTAWVTSMGSSRYQWNTVTVDHYDFLEDQPRVPFLSSTANFGTGDTAEQDFPAEVSICLSFRGDYASGDNKARKRGRVYLGPLRFGTSDREFVASFFTDMVADAAEDAFFDALNLTKLAVYSFYTHHDVPVGTKYTNQDEFPEVPDALPASFTPVTALWCDNAWDIQRRRGLKATARDTRTAP